MTARIQVDPRYPWKLTQRDLLQVIEEGVADGLLWKEGIVKVVEVKAYRRKG